MAFDLTVTTRGQLPRIPFEKLAASILGPSYTLSLVVCGDDLAQRMNVTYRKKNYRPNVLSFPLAKAEGEIFLNIRKAAREARSEGVSVDDRVAFLFIHGCLHLKGHDHGDTMDSLEDRYMRTLKKR